jgi:hypothetical protein
MEINDQYDFFKAIKVDNDGNLLVKVEGITGGTGNNFYTTGATLVGNTIVFDRNDQVNAYSVDLSGITATGNIDGGKPNDILIFSNIDGGSVV